MMVLAETERVALILEETNTALRLALELEELETSGSKDAIALGRMTFHLWASKKISNEIAKAHRWTIGAKKIFIITREH